MLRVIKHRSYCPAVPDRRAWMLVCVAVSGALSLSGCERPPAADADDIIAYVRNGAVGARVRHLGPDAQPYVQNVFKAHGDWQNALAPIVELADVDALWDKDEKTWRDSESVSARRQTIREWQSQPQHEQLLQQLMRAIQAVPSAFEEHASRITTQAEDDLIVTDVEYLNRVASQYETLLELVQKAEPDFDEKKEGLVFGDAETTQAAHLAWDQLHQTLAEAKRKELEQEQRMAQRMLGEGRRLRDKAIEKKRSARQGTSDPEEALRTTRKLDIDIHYYDQMIQRAEKQQRKLTAAKTQAQESTEAATE